MNMSDVAYVKVFRPPFVGAIGGGSNGAIAVYTRKGGDIKPKEGKGLPYKILIGYTGEKNFILPIMVLTTAAIPSRISALLYTGTRWY
jgi:hypothetical protein